MLNGNKGIEANTAEIIQELLKITLITMQWKARNKRRNYIQ